MSLTRWLPIPRIIALALTVLLAVLVVTSCGGGSGATESQPTGSLSFQLQWDRTSTTSDRWTKYGTGDCADVDTVSAAAYDSSGGLLQTGGPWDCADHAGSLSQVPANQNVHLAIVGHDVNGTALYRGESAEFFLPGGGSADAGLILTGSFGTTLTAPTYGAIVAPSALTLEWNAVTGAESYVVQITDESFDTTILQTINVDATATPSCRPDTSTLVEDIAYFWRVLVVDGAGNTSEPSAESQFYVSSSLLMVTITSPSNNSQVRVGDVVDFNATVSDNYENPLTSEDLSVISWSSNLVGALNSALSFSISDLTVGVHTITLDVEDNSGLTGSANVAIEVLANLLPTAQITIPDAGYLHPVYNSLTCQGSGTDPEDGTLTGTALQWEIVELANPSNVWNGTGETPYVDYMFFMNSGTYRVTLTVTDSDGGTDTVTNDFLVAAF